MITALHFKIRKYGYFIYGAGEGKMPKILIT